MFIVFEGGEKVGKTTQLARAKHYLEAQTYTVVFTHEPGGGDQDIRKKLLNKKSILTTEEELDLFCRDRALHIENIIKPALKKSALVLCDRFEPSSIAYQGYGRGMNIEHIREKSKQARQDIWPDLILLLDADPNIVLSREEATSRFDAEKIEFHQKVRQGFLAQAAEDPTRWRVIDATKSMEEVWQEIKKHIDMVMLENKDAFFKT
ncbi:MAG: dTMP kinase [Candidatus Ryanbacteria bacterium RIFCSPHIGHO2_02_FULL_45_13b]|uniref:Thymidylate kinase n=1 Tax=Candidatus Ryanbacteria bacterium RIFCSPHIGHO2_02_FULL_45_13b TaxID=1802117 RepID=A0A1G2G8Q6_9BACT|nr:MAG: dTMP kinase [Candidatus Ryanbacteria bacterium RIFCSPHIGHO2_02_FULL_45_13b]